MMAGTQTAKTQTARPRFEVVTIAELGRRYDLDRASVRKYLREAGIEPVSIKAKEKLFEITPQLDKVLDQTDTKLTEAKLRKENADARLKEIKLAEAEGELAPVGEFTEYVQALFGAMHKEMAVRMPQRLAPRLGKAKTASDAKKVLTVEVNHIFKVLRENHETYLRETKR